MVGGIMVLHDGMDYFMLSVVPSEQMLFLRICFGVLTL